MAYAYDPNLDPDRDDEEQSQTIAAGGQMSAGSPQESAAEARPGSKIEDRFQNIDAYLKGNESKQFGSQVAGRVQSEVDKASQAQSEADRDFRSRSDQGTTRFDEGLTNRAIQDPESFLTSPEFNKFVSQRDAQYAGPSSLSDTQDLESRADGTTRAAASKARATESESGRFGLLDDYFARPSYTQGEKTLDQALVQTDKSAEPAFQRAQSSAKQNVANLETMRRNLSDYAAQNRGVTEQARTQTRGALDTAMGDVKTGVNNRLTQRQTQQQSERAAIEDALKSRDLTKLTPELRQILGLEDVDAFYGVDPTQYLSAGQLSAQNVATRDEAKRLGALSKLANTEDTFLNPDLAGTMDDEALVGFNSAGFKQANDDRAWDYADALYSGRGSALPASRYRGTRNVKEIVRGAESAIEGRLAALQNRIREYEDGGVPDLAIPGRREFEELSRMYQAAQQRVGKGKLAR